MLSITNQKSTINNDSQIKDPEINNRHVYFTKISIISTGAVPLLWNPCCVPAFM